MMPEIASGLEQLELLLNRMGELIEWEKVTEVGTPKHLPPAFKLRDHFSEDMRTLYGTFLDLANSLKDVLDLEYASVSRAQRNQWLEQVSDLEKRLRGLRVTERYLRR